MRPPKLTGKQIAFWTLIVAVIGVIVALISLYKPIPPRTSQPTIKQTGSATTSGPNSPAVTGGTNTFDYGTEGQKPGDKK